MIYYILKDDFPQNCARVLIYAETLDKIKASIASTAKGNIAQSASIDIKLEKILHEILGKISEELKKRTGCASGRFKIIKKSSSMQVLIESAIPQTFAGIFRETLFNIQNKCFIAPEEVNQFICRSANGRNLPWNTSSTNMRYLLDYAVERNIKINFLDVLGVQIGQGHYSHTFSSTATFKASLLGSRVCKDKLLFEKFIASLGLPSTNSILCTRSNQDEIYSKFDSFRGHPLVVKPKNLDRGIAVTTDIFTLEHLKQAVRTGLQHSNVLLIQRKLFGDTFRVNTANGKLISCLRRKKAQIVGDGTSSIGKLLANFLTSKDYLKKCEAWGKNLIDERHVIELIERNGYKLDKIAAPNEIIEISTTHNANNGATTTDVAKADIHPSYLEVSELLTHALNLDFMGVDWISEDFSRPWFETSSTILEANNMPQIGERAAGATYAGIFKEFPCKNMQFAFASHCISGSAIQLSKLAKEIESKEFYGSYGLFMWVNNEYFHIYRGTRKIGFCTMEKFISIIQRRPDAENAVIFFDPLDEHQSRVFSHYKNFCREGRLN